MVEMFLTLKDNEDTNVRKKNGINPATGNFNEIYFIADKTCVNSSPQTIELTVLIAIQSMY